jgi:hypothetical protein
MSETPGGGAPGGSKLDALLVACECYKRVKAAEAQRVKAAEARRVKVAEAQRVKEAEAQHAKELEAQLNAMLAVQQRVTAFKARLAELKAQHLLRKAVWTRRSRRSRWRQGDRDARRSRRKSSRGAALAARDGHQGDDGRRLAHPDRRVHGAGAATCTGLSLRASPAPATRGTFEARAPGGRRSSRQCCAAQQPWCAGAARCRWGATHQGAARRGARTRCLLGGAALVRGRREQSRRRCPLGSAEHQRVRRCSLSSAEPR